MSNRLRDAGTLPLIVDPVLAIRMGRSAGYGRGQTEQTVALGKAFLAILRGVGRAVSWIGRAVETGMRLRDLYALNDRQLAELGVTRSEIPRLCAEDRIARFDG